MDSIEKNEHLTDMFYTHGKGWFVDTCRLVFPLAVGEKTYETLVAPSSIKCSVTRKNITEPTLTLQYHSAEEAKITHEKIVEILKTVEPEKAPAALRKFKKQYLHVHKTPSRDDELER